EVRLNAYPKERFAGSIDYIGTQVDAVARTLTARIRLKNDRRLLRIGLFGNAYVAIAEENGAPVLAVPLDAGVEIAGKPAVLVAQEKPAVFIAPGKPTVFIAQEGGNFFRHDVVLGREGIGLVEVQSGLDEGEHVVVEGVFTLKAVLLKSTIPTED